MRTFTGSHYYQEVVRELIICHFTSLVIDTYLVSDCCTVLQVAIFWL